MGADATGAPRQDFRKLTDLALYRQLRDTGAFATPRIPRSDLTLDTAELTQVSCGIVQVIVAAQVTARVLDRNLQVEVAADTPFAAALDRLGLQL